MDWFLQQAIERAPLQMSSSSEEQTGSSGATEDGLSESDNMEVRGSRFSKSADERQKMLKQRKEELIQQARRSVHCWLEFSAKCYSGALMVIRNDLVLIVFFH